MKNAHNLGYFFAIFLFFFSCNRSSMLKVEMNICPKQIELESAEAKDSGTTTIKLLHNGFCYDFIDSLNITRKYFTGTQKLFIEYTDYLSRRNFRMDNQTDDNCHLNIKSHELSDTAQNITAEITAIYKNGSSSNTVEFSYQTPCNKEISNPTSILLDTSACETSAGTGDRFLVSFRHKGYCTTEIDSIGGSGKFYSFDGYFWNSSDFLVPRERIIFHENNSFVQRIDFKLCVTFHETDFVRNKIWLIYKDKTRSNKAAFEIIFNRHKKKEAILKNNKGHIE